MNNGWIKLHRRIRNNWVWKDNKPFDKRAAWIDILLMVNHKTKKVLFGSSLITVKRGERITSLRKLSGRWKWSRTKVRNFLKLLEKDDMIVTKKDHQKTTIKVCNYSDLQNSEKTKKDTGVPREYHEKDTRVPRENINNNDKKEKNDKNEEEKTIASSKFTEFDYRLSKEFLAYQKEQFPKLVNNKKKDIKNGADTIRLLREQDDFTEEEITGTLRFAVKDNFWRDKVLSVANIRKRSKNGKTKFQNIYLRYKNKPKTRTEQVMDIDLSEGDTIWNT